MRAVATAVLLLMSAAGSVFFADMDTSCVGGGGCGRTGDGWDTGYFRKRCAESTR